MQQQNTTYQSQMPELQRRVGELDVSNRDLHTRLAQSEQQQQIYRDQTQLLQQQLRDTANQLKETQLARQDAEKSVQMLQASTRKQGGAMITANNSVRQSLAIDRHTRRRSAAGPGRDSDRDARRRIVPGGDRAAGAVRVCVSGQSG